MSGTNMKRTVSMDLELLPDTFIVALGSALSGPITHDARFEENARPRHQFRNITVADLKQRAEAENFTDIEILALVPLP